jgi:hypothetical protein
MKSVAKFALLLAAVSLSACQTPQAQVVAASQKSVVELRAMQGRTFETNDRAKTIRAVIATLQDLGYGVEKVEVAAGTVSARKLDALQMTVSVFPHGSNTMVVRANAVVRTDAASTQVDAPEFYQRYFFEPLAKAMFLTANADIGDDLRPTPSAPSASASPGASPTTNSSSSK